MALAEWAANGAAPNDLWPVDIHRFGLVLQSTDWDRARMLEAYDRHMPSLAVRREALGPPDPALAAFPFATAHRISVAGCPVLALRVTYVDELGWELHMPTDVAVTVSEALTAAGAPHGLVNARIRSDD